MRINLKKAYEYKRLALAAAEKIPLNSTTTLSVFSDVTPEQKIMTARREIDAGLIACAELFSVASRLSAALGRANVTCGVSDLLAVMENNQQISARLSALLERFSNETLIDDGETAVADDFQALLTQKTSLRTAHETADRRSYGLSESLTLPVLGGPEVQRLRGDVARLRRAISALKDDLMRRNIQNDIELSDEDAAILRRHNLID